MQLVRRAESREQIVRSKRCYTPSPSATIAEGENLQISAFAYNTGDRVKRQAPYKSAVVGKSFDPKWIRPYRITKFVAEYVVVLELIEPVHHPEGTRRIRVKPVIIYIWKKKLKHCRTPEENQTTGLVLAAMAMYSEDESDHEVLAVCKEKWRKRSQQSNERSRPSDGQQLVNQRTLNVSRRLFKNYSRTSEATTENSAKSEEISRDL